MKIYKKISLLTVILMSGLSDLSAQYSFNPDFEAIKSRVSFVPGIKVIRGETISIVPRHESVCPIGSVFKFNNGDLQVYDRRSSDGGKTWIKVNNILEPSTFQFPGRNGEVLMFLSAETNNEYESDRGFSPAGRPDNHVIKTNRDGVFEAILLRSKDNGITRTEERVKIFIPDEMKDLDFTLSRKIVMIKDQSLLMSLYGKSKEKNGGKKYFVGIIRSVDNGKTWHYYTTVAFGLNSNVRPEGFYETTLLVIPDGRIMCFMRSGASYQAALGSSNNNDPAVKMPFGYNIQTPVYMSISGDNGKTWSNADPISHFGVWPDALMLSNGILAVTYGRPGNWIMFSRDVGETWGPVLQFFNDLYPPDCGNYFSITEIEPDIILAVYSKADTNDHWYSEIVGTYFMVKRLD